VHLHHRNPLRRWSTCQSQRSWSRVQALSSSADLAVALGSMKEVASCCNSDHRVHFTKCWFNLRLFNEYFFLFITSDYLKKHFKVHTARHEKCSKIFAGKLEAMKPTWQTYGTEVATLAASILVKTVTIIP